jgi:hypothetical protein
VIIQGYVKHCYHNIPFLRFSPSVILQGQTLSSQSRFDFVVFFQKNNLTTQVLPQCYIVATYFSILKANVFFFKNDWLISSYRHIENQYNY